MEHFWLKEAKTVEEEAVRDYRWLHAHAEVGFSLERTYSYVKSRLLEMGIAASDCGRTGLVAVIGEGGAGTLLLRADMDALPIKEESGLAFSGQNGYMHACGHDMHTAMLLGAAKLLKKHENALRCRVKLMFQPAEELLSGAADMIGAGVLTDPVPDAAFALHVVTGVPYPTGTLFLPAAGVGAPAADYFSLLIKGKGSHGAMPQSGIDPLPVAAQILLGTQTLLTRECSLRESAMLTFGSILAGEAHNVIPDKALLKGTLRTLDEATRARLKRRLGEVSSGIAAAFGATAELTFDYGAPALLNSGTLLAMIKPHLAVLLGDRRLIDLGAGGEGGLSFSGGSEDFSHISQRLPSLMAMLCAGDRAAGYLYPLHHPSARFDESVLPIGVAVFCTVAALFEKNR